MADGLIERGIKCPLWQFRDRKEGEVATDLGLLAEKQTIYRLQAEQWRAEAARARLSAETDGIDHRYRCRDVSQDGDGVTVTARRATGEVETFRLPISSVRMARSTLSENPLVWLFQPDDSRDFYASQRRSDTTAIEGLADICYISDPDEWLVLLHSDALAGSVPNRSKFE